MSFVQDVFVKGGPVMWPLLGCSVVSLTIAVERLIFWWRETRHADENMTEKVFALTERGDYSGAVAAGRGGDAVARMLVSGLTHREHGLSEAMEVAAGREVESMKTGLTVLDTIITMAPMLGILGTVTGIIRCFNLLGESGVSDPRAATTGLAEALITTAAGLIIALATLLPFNYLVARVQTAARRLEQVATQFQVAFAKGVAGKAGAQ